VTETGKFVGPCCRCKSEMWLPQALYDAANHGKGAITFYCAYGHSQVFAQGESEAEILRRERDRLKQQMAYHEDTIRELAKERDAARATAKALAKATKSLKTRAAAGVCPCCHRTVSQMKRHMQSKHPNFINAEEVQ
jgi:hypothetical protein